MKKLMLLVTIILLFSLFAGAGYAKTYADSFDGTSKIASQINVTVNNAIVLNKFSGEVISVEFTRQNYSSWNKIGFTSNIPSNTSIIIDILDSNDNTLVNNVSSGEDISSITNSRIRLKGTFQTNSSLVTPILYGWRVSDFSYNLNIYSDGKIKYVNEHFILTQNLNDSKAVIMESDLTPSDMNIIQNTNINYFTTEDNLLISEVASDLGIIREGRSFERNITFNSMSHPIIGGLEGNTYYFGYSVFTDNLSLDTESQYYDNITVLATTSDGRPYLTLTNSSNRLRVYFASQPYYLQDNHNWFNILMENIAKTLLDTDYIVEIPITLSKARKVVIWRNDDLNPNETDTSGNYPATIEMLTNYTKIFDDNNVPLTYGLLPKHGGKLPADNPEFVRYINLIQDDNHIIAMHGYEHTILGDTEIEASIDEFNTQGWDYKNVFVAPSNILDSSLQSRLVNHNFTVLMGVDTSSRRGSGKVWRDYGSWLLLEHEFGTTISYSPPQAKNYAQVKTGIDDSKYTVVPVMDHFWLHNSSSLDDLNTYLNESSYNQYLTAPKFEEYYNWRAKTIKNVKSLYNSSADVLTITMSDDINVTKFNQTFKVNDTFADVILRKTNGEIIPSIKVKDNGSLFLIPFRLFDVTIKGRAYNFYENEGGLAFSTNTPNQIEIVSRDNKLFKGVTLDWINQVYINNITLARTLDRKETMKQINVSILSSSSNINVTVNEYSYSKINLTAVNSTADQKMSITVGNGTFEIINGNDYTIKKDGTLQQTKTASGGEVTFSDIDVGSGFVISVEIEESKDFSFLGLDVTKIFIVALFSIFIIIIYYISGSKK